MRKNWQPSGIRLDICFLVLKILHGAKRLLVNHLKICRLSKVLPKKSEKILIFLLKPNLKTLMQFLVLKRRTDANTCTLLEKPARENQRLLQIWQSMIFAKTEALVLLTHMVI